MEEIRRWETWGSSLGKSNPPSARVKGFTLQSDRNVLWSPPAPLPETGDGRNRAGSLRTGRAAKCCVQRHSELFLSWAGPGPTDTICLSL